MMMLILARFLVSLVLNFDRFSQGATLQRDVFLATRSALEGATRNPVILRVAIDGAEAIITVRGLTQNVGELADLTQRLDRATGLQVSPVDG